MAKNKLLNEAQVRRFMSLSGIKPLNEMGYKMEEDEEMNEMGHKMEEEEHALQEQEDEAEMGADDDAEMGAEEDPESTVELEQDDVDALADFAQKLPDIVSKLQGAEAGMDDEADMDMDMGDMDMEDDEEMDMGDEDEEAEEDAEEVMEEALRGVNLQLSDKEIVNEVARRVAKRILKAKQAQKSLDEALGNKRRRPYRRSKK